jgi:ATP-binding cassette subfamily F protein 3
VLVADTQATPFDGDLDDYASWLLAARDADSEPDQSANAAGSRKDERKSRAEQRKALQPIRNKIKKLEAELEALHQKKQALDGKLSDPELYDASRVDEQKSLSMENRRLMQEIDEKEAEWLMAGEELEVAE